MEVMLPLIGAKNYGAFVAQNAEYLSTKASSMKSISNILSVPAYFKLVDQVQQIPTAIRREVANLVQSLSQPMISAHGSKMFLQYLPKLVSDPAGRSDLCRKLISCLRADDNTYENWRKVYRSNLFSSSLFLQWVTDNEQAYARESRDFQTTLSHFQTVNLSYSPSGKPPQGLKGCVQHCEYLIGSKSNKKRPTKSGSKLKYINYLMLIALVSLVYYDTRVYGEGQFVNSRLGKAAERFGVTEKALELHQVAQPYLVQAQERFVLLKDVVTRKAGEVHQRAEPYLNQAGEGLVQLRDVVYRKTEELYPGFWKEADAKYQALVLITKEKAAFGYSVAVQYAELGYSVAVQYAELGYSVALKNLEIGKDVGAKYWDQFLEWSTVYRQQLSLYTAKAIEMGGDYVQRGRQMTAEFMAKEQVQHALKYSYDMYHKALHAVGLCSH
jgi:hypothetical protein